MARAKRKADQQTAQEVRRGTRTRRTVQEVRDAEAAQAQSGKPNDQEDTAERYNPPSTSARVLPSSLRLDQDRRDSRGGIIFDDHPEFRPTLRPADVIKAGSFGGIYFNPKGGRPGIISPQGVDITHEEFPADWFEGLRPEQYRGRKYTIAINKYGVKAGQNQAAWEEKGWIKPELDPRGWFHWYCRFYQGRRTDDDDRQIHRWRGVAGEKGRWKRSLANRCLKTNKRWDDASVSPVLRQTLLHWAYELTEADFNQMRKRM